MARVFTLRNSGDAGLGDIVVSKSGADDSHFLLTAPATNSISSGASTTFSVSFIPTASGSRSAQISITSNDTNNSPFIINLSGFGLGEDLDTDGDGLNDAAEYLLRDLGFDWNVAQPELVALLFDNAAAAGLYSSNHIAANASDFGLFTPQQHSEQFETGRAVGEAVVIDSPVSFGLFTAAQYEANRTAGQLDVVADPARFNLYDRESIMDLRMGGLMIQKLGAGATIVFQPQTTTDLATQPFTNHGTPITNTVNMPGNKGFLRIQAQPE